jgi:hypothetical protein
VIGDEDQIQRGVIYEVLISGDPSHGTVRHQVQRVPIGVVAIRTGRQGDIEIDLLAVDG